MLYPTGTLEEWPGRLKSESRLRVREALATRRLLWIAAAFFLVRITVLPWLIHWSPPGTFPGPGEMEVIQDGLMCAGIFILAALLARHAPLFAVLISTAVFGGIIYQDLTRYSDWMAQGLIGKAIVGMLLLRAFMNALMSR
ncbi:MAG TPA: hypothetical protein VGB55_03970, partial [Tepidisphaeraceae bacterium]